MIRMNKKKKKMIWRLIWKLNKRIWKKKKMIFLMIVDMIKEENSWLCEKVKYVRN